LGCTLCSEGCVHCYAEAMSRRLAGMAQHNPANDRKRHYLPVINNRGRWSDHLEKVEEALEDPLGWKKPSTIFVNSMSDLFHPNVDSAYIESVFDVMRRAHWHQFQILTKRSERLLELSPTLPWMPNMWQGVSVELPKYKFRIEYLRQTDAAVKFLSLEPQLGPLGELDLRDIDWMIVGGESGPGCRPMDVQRVRDIRRRCEQADIAFFFKQCGHKKIIPIVRTRPPNKTVAAPRVAGCSTARSTTRCPSVSSNPTFGGEKGGCARQRGGRPLTIATSCLS
jgi:protein gp37